MRYWQSSPLTIRPAKKDTPIRSPRVGPERRILALGSIRNFVRSWALLENLPGAINTDLGGARVFAAPDPESEPGTDSGNRTAGVPRPSVRRIVPSGYGTVLGKRQGFLR